MTTHFDYDIRRKRELLAELVGQTAELERRVADAQLSLDRELRLDRELGLSDVAYAPLGEPPVSADSFGLADPGLSHQAGAPHEPPFDPAAGDRTEVLLRHGRAGAAPRLTRSRKLVLAGTAGTILLVILILVLTMGGASWPGSVAVVQRQAVVACRNPDVRSEPSQANFACAKETSQILWVFALLTSRDDPAFKDARTGRVGLEPISAAQGGQLAWSLNLHHPYDPSNPVDSLAVAARAINNIVGGATLTSAGGRPVVQAGLESSAANCRRYTGSAAMTRRSGFPPHCAHAVTTAAGQAALVADIYQKWVVGAGPRAAQDAAVLFANAQNPGNSGVQAILRRLAADGPLT